MEQIELGMFVFSVLFNAQLFLEVALSLCIPFFPLPSALYGGTYLCVCNVCMCVHVSRVCNKQHAVAFKCECTSVVTTIPLIFLLFLLLWLLSYA